MLAFLLAALAALVPPDTTLADTLVPPPQPAVAAWQVPPPEAPLASRDTVREPIEVRPRLVPTALYSGSHGIGIAGGVGIRNAGFDGSDLTLDLRVSQRYQSLTLAAFTADPYEASLYGLATVEASRTVNERYYGTGPFSDEVNRLYLDYASFDAEVRVGAYPLGNTGLFLQPGGRFLLDRLRDVEEDQEGALERLGEFDSPSLAAVETALDETRYGVSVGLEVASDLRDWRSYPRRGTFVSVEGRRFFSLDGSGLQFNRLAVSTIGYLPIRGRTALVGRSNLVLTRADGGDDIPFYYLPVLDTQLLTAYPPGRFVGRDVLALGGGIRFPIRDFIGVYGIDALIMGFLGNAYDNVFDQVSADITFGQGAIQRETSGGRVPLRPSLGIGLGIVNLDKERVVLGGLIGISPDGLTLASLRIAYDLRDARPLFR